MYLHKPRKVVVTTTVPLDLKEEAEKKGIKLSYALQYGLKVLMGHESNLLKQTNQRINELKDENQKLRDRIMRLQEIIKEMGEKIEALGGSV